MDLIDTTGASIGGSAMRSAAKASYFETGSDTYVS
jgi:Asp-tRNA(Asn)/Glu-tRNA(Gln) amidotransferase A subunit family amidase